NFGVQIALPLRDRTSGEVIGVLRTTYILSGLSSILEKRVGNTGAADILVPGEIQYHIHEGQFSEVAPAEAEQLQSAFGQGMIEMEYENELSVITQAKVQSSEGHTAVDTLGWIVVFHQHRDEALAALDAQLRGIILTLLIVVAAAGAAAFGFSQALVRPIAQLTQISQEISTGNLDSRAAVSSKDEVGTLAVAFNTMASRLQNTLQGLEQRVAERTQNLELAAEVGRSVSQVRDLDIMLKDAAEIIRSRFDLYYTQVYLVNPSQKMLMLQSGTGSVGTELVGRGHRLPIDTGSINGRAAVEKRSVVISDTTTSPTFRPNPLLPETRSEMAIPLIAGENVVGVLDLQSREAGALTQDLLSAFEALGGQLAVAIQNAKLLADVEQARADVESQARRLVRQNWDAYLDGIHKPEHTGFEFKGNQVTPMEDSDVATQMAENGTALSAPIALSGESIGVLAVELDIEGQSAQTAELINSVAQQVAQQIENLRLLETADRYRYEAELAARRQTREGWQEFMNARTDDRLGYLFDLNKVRPHQVEEDDESTLAVPIKVRDEAIGKLSIQGLASDDYRSLELTQTVAERLGAHIESLRQYDRTQSALTQSEKLFDASRRLTQASDLQDVTAATVNTLGIPEVNRALLAMFDYNAEGNIEQMTIVANWWNETGHEVTSVGTRYPLEVIRAMPMFVSSTPVFFNDTFNDERVDATTMQLVKRLNLRAVAV
ncbi:MAG: GAF domain-containing protein, partial [Chloroflexota bacterium]